MEYLPPEAIDTGVPTCGPVRIKTREASEGRVKIFSVVLEQENILMAENDGFTSSNI
jgi:hypothetical protein